MMDELQSKSSFYVMGKFTRRLIAISELGGGVLLMMGSAFAILIRVHLPALDLLFIESVGAIALIAGYRLLQNRPEGFSLSLGLQASQLVQVFFPRFVYRLLLGPYLTIVMSADEGSIAPGFKGELTIGSRGPHSAAFGFNGVAAIFCLLLGRAILARRRGVTVATKD